MHGEDVTAAARVSTRVQTAQGARGWARAAFEDDVRLHANAAVLGRRGLVFPRSGEAADAWIVALIHRRPDATALCAGRHGQGR